MLDNLVLSCAWFVLLLRFLLVSSFQMLLHCVPFIIRSFFFFVCERVLLALIPIALHKYM